MWGRAIAVAICAGLCIGLAAPAHAAFPGKNGKIAYVSGGDIWTVNPDGTGRVQITSGSGAYGEPHWSPDGARIAVTSNRDDPSPGCYPSCFDLYIMDADGSDVSRVTNTSGPYGNFSPTWSPDGTRLAFSRGSAIWTIATDGTDERRASPVPPGCPLRDYYLPTWSPDGTEIAATGADSCDHIIDLVCFLDPDGGPEDCGYGMQGESVENWSPDGAQLVGGTDGVYRGLFRDDRNSFFDFDGVELTPQGVAYDGYYGNAAWSPDGQKIVFQRSPYDESSGWLYIIDAADGGNLVRLSPEDAYECCPDWQPIPINSYPRPKGATPFLTYLVPAYNACASPNRVHGPALAFASCNPPTQSSNALTVGSADSNGKPTKSVSSVRFDTVVGNPSIPGDQADVKITAQVIDVYTQAGLADYAGELTASTPLRITDKLNTPHPGGPGAGTVSDIPYGFTIPCAETADATIGGACLLSTSADALAPGAVTETKRSIWALGQVAVYDANNAPFMKQGIFVP